MSDSNNQESTAPRLALRSQYIKDLSFENPNVPTILFNNKSTPKVDFNLELGARQLNDDAFELVMNFNIRTSAEKTMFIIELSYAGLFEIANIPEDKMEQVLMVDCAFILFPFARRILADITRDGGYPPLLLEPIDFVDMHIKRKQQQEGE